MRSEPLKIEIRVALVVVAIAIGVAATWLPNSALKIGLQLLGLVVFGLNAKALSEAFQRRAEAGKRDLESGVVAPWHPAGAAIFYVALVPFAVGLLMLVQVLYPRSTLIPGSPQLGLVLFGVGLGLMLIGRWIGGGRL
jgi:hypothetical protein